MSKPLKNILYRIAIALVIAMFFIGDQALKYLALNLQPQENIVLLENILDFRFTPNYYIAFSIPLSGVLLNMLILSLILLLLVYFFYLIKKKQIVWLEIICFALMIAGAISNFSDRLINGYVIDYLYLRRFSVLNLADIMISSGALILIIRGLKRPG